MYSPVCESYRNMSFVSIQEVCPAKVFVSFKRQKVTNSGYKSTRHKPFVARITLDFLLVCLSVFCLSVFVSLHISRHICLSLYFSLSIRVWLSVLVLISLVYLVAILCVWESTNLVCLLQKSYESYRQEHASKGAKCKKYNNVVQDVFYTSRTDAMLSDKSRDWNCVRRDRFI